MLSIAFTPPLPAMLVWLSLYTSRFVVPICHMNLGHANVDPKENAKWLRHIVIVNVMKCHAEQDDVHACFFSWEKSLCGKRAMRCFTATMTFILQGMVE